MPENTHSIYHQAAGLGRLPSVDPRDRNFLMRAITPPVPPTITKMFWEIPQVLDQGRTSECTSYSSQYLLMCGPVKNKMYKTPNQLYKEIQRNDQWYPTPHDGSSVRAAMKTLKDLGYLNNYVWAFNIKDVVNFLLTTGPVILGTDWTTEMFKVNRQTGFIQAKGDAVGGHAYLIRGCDNNLKCPDGSRGALRILNSWGRFWGDKGLAWISYKDADKLIKRNGEAASPSELHKL